MLVSRVTPLDLEGCLPIVATRNAASALISSSADISLISLVNISSFPHGMWMTLLGIFMAVLSWALTLSAHATCFFVQGNDVRQTGFGIWTKENLVPTPSNDYTCQEYTWAETHLMDTKWNAAAGLAYSAGLIGFIFAVFLMGSSCAAYSRAFFKLAGVNYLVAGIFDFCTLIGVNSDICTIFTADYVNVTDFATECTFGTGAILAIVGGVCYFITAGICFFMPPAREDKQGNNGGTEGPVVAATSDKSGEGADSTPANDKGSTKEAGGDVEMNMTATSPPAGQDNAPVDTAKPVDESSTSSLESNASIIRDDIGTQGFWTMFSDYILFLIGSVFFLWLSILDLQWGKEVQAFADAIDGSFSLRDNAIKELQGYTGDDDDYVFQTRYHWISLYQIVYFIAGAAFMIEGFLEFFVTPGIRGIWFTFAGGTGLLAAWLSERDSQLSSIFSLISSCLFVVEAIGLVLYRSDFTGQLKFWSRVNDICFVIATTIDVVLSFTTLFKVYRMSLLRTDIAAASLWLFCALIYVGFTLYAKRNGYFDKQETDKTPAQEQAEKLEAAADTGSADKPPEEQAVNSNVSE